MTLHHYYGPVEDIDPVFRRLLRADLLPLINKHEALAYAHYQQARGEGPVFKDISPSDILPGWFAHQQNVASAHHAIRRFLVSFL